MIPSPTPYDITEMPTFPLETPGVWWLTILGILLLQALFFSAWIELKKQRKKLAQQPAQLIKKELEKIVTTLQQDKNIQSPQLDKIAFLLRELSSATLNVSVLGATAREIEQIYLTQEKEPHGIQLLSMIDSYRYAAAMTEEVQQELIEHLENYCKRIV